MGKKVYFLDSIKQSDGSYDNTYGVDDVNAIVSNLVGAGVAPFPSGNTYDVSELNSLTSALVAEGTSLDGLKVSFADNKIHIAQGIGYFENGATIVVDSDGEELDYTVAETLYVYAEYNQVLNTCGFYTSEKEPVKGTGIYTLMLATIVADGTVTDKRMFARSKVATLGRNLYLDVFTPTEDKTYSAGETICTVDVGDYSRYRHLCFFLKATDNRGYSALIPTESLTDYNDKPIIEIYPVSKLRMNLTGNMLKIYVSEDGSLYLQGEVSYDTKIFLS